MTATLQSLAETLSLGALLDRVVAGLGGYELLDHWQQGEFHHDTVLRVRGGGLPGPILVVATNCNGGVKEVLCFDQVPERGALWHARCPDSPEFAGELPPVLGEARTLHWFNPCELLACDARSELKADARERQAGGGWTLKPGSERSG